jgi:hypothetical protein
MRGVVHEQSGLVIGLAEAPAAVESPVCAIDSGVHRGRSSLFKRSQRSERSVTPMRMRDQSTVWMSRAEVSRVTLGGRRRFRRDDIRSIADRLGTGFERKR